jgi:hypothetical protein
MLGGVVLDHVDSITDLGVVMDSRAGCLFLSIIDVTIGKVLAMLRSVRRLSGKFMDLLCVICAPEA